MEVYPGGVKARGWLGWFLGQSVQDTAFAVSSKPAYLPSRAQTRETCMSRQMDHASFKADSPGSPEPWSLFSSLILPFLLWPCASFPCSPLFSLSFLLNPGRWPLALTLVRSWADGAGGSPLRGSRLLMTPSLLPLLLLKWGYSQCQHSQHETS